jgi:hypothetical protein
MAGLQVGWWSEVPTCEERHNRLQSTVSTLIIARSSSGTLQSYKAAHDVGLWATSDAFFKYLLGHRKLATIVFHSLLNDGVQSHRAARPSDNLGPLFLVHIKVVRRL